MGRNGHGHQRRIERFERVLRFIEAHYTEELDTGMLARMASVSPFHFHRVFSDYIDEPVLGFVRRLRLELAARALLFRGLNVTAASDLAGYSTPAAFTRAFRQQFGTTPVTFVRRLLEQRASVPTALFPVAGSPQHRTLPERSLLCVQRTGSYDGAPCMAWCVMREFLVSKGVEPADVARFGIPLDWPEVTPRDRLRYLACVECDLPAEGEFFRRNLAGGDYAQFLFEGSRRQLQQFHEAILWHWYPASGTTLRDDPSLHCYVDAAGGSGAPEHLCTEVYVPVATGFSNKAA